MKRLCIFVSVFFICGLFSVNALDMIVLKDGNMIEAKVLEMSPTEIRYKRADNLNGPTIVLPVDRVLSIRYENGVLDIINPGPSNASPAAGQGRGQTGGAAPSNAQLGEQTPLQIILNALPAIPIAGNTLKFQFGGDNWVTTINGENFSMGTIELEDIEGGVMLTLRQTHIWPGAAGKTAGRLASMVPGGGAVGGVLNAAGSVAGLAGAVEAPGPVMVLEYKAGPPAKLTYSRRASERSTRERASPSDGQWTGGHPLFTEERFDLDGVNVFAFSLYGLIGNGGGGGITLTIFEGYKPDVFFTPSFFFSGRFEYLFAVDDPDLGQNAYGYSGHKSATLYDYSLGVLFKHRFPRDRVLWNVGASLEFMLADGWASGYYTYPDNTYSGYSSNSVSYNGSSFLFGMGIQTGFSFRVNPYTSIDLNGFIKFPFGTATLTQDSYGYSGSSYSERGNLPTSVSYWPLAAGGELAFTFWTPYRSKK
jgi:hypothetical protein